jgi:trk system potassium uptake protein TrkA/voltage-gated potassium channel
MAGQHRSTEAGVRDVFGSPLRNLSVALAFVLIVFVASTAGFVMAGWPLGDALYMVTLTIFSVGYGEVRPIDTMQLRLLAIATIVLGCTGMIVLTGALVQVFASFQLRRIMGIDRMHNEIDRLSGHTIVCGLGRIGHQLAKELALAHSPFVIVERQAGKLAEARALGYLCLAGDATDEDALREAGIARARVLATVLPDDAANVFITLSARNLNPRLEIIARGEAPSTEGKLIHAGADRVVLPTHIGAERIAELILYPATASVVSDDARLLDMRRTMREFGLEVEVVNCDPKGALTGRTVGEAEKRGDGAFFIVQIDRPGGLCIRHPGENVRIEPDDRLLLVLRGTRVAAGGVFAAPRAPVRIGRGYLK